jgi:hypothetical protein
VPQTWHNSSFVLSLFLATNIQSRVSEEKPGGLVHIGLTFAQIV